MDDILQALRNSTGSLHKELDDAVMTAPITSAAGYERFLNMHARVLPAVESWMASQPLYHTLPAASARLRSEALTRDLEQMGISAPKVMPMSFLQDRTSVLGISYVLEGSRLGGAKLAQVIKSSGKTYPVSFLQHGQGQSYWKSFLAWLTARDETPENAREAADAAVNLFKAYLQSAHLSR
ncbi:biliverdin-producing heme oxygenase [Rhizobium sp. L1K21]|uniref:biliverdin-producing heme oxygenase n=1 Tax=Rhizobium sp. L1K21 TaxID=2954933 RepID=UPI00209319EC|nr:biliverdin-producing heme oxygenase [Rhizobium sp. L1K21]MCO6186282.1 biliverdin-producing heme oxygenase [Rhizobium sp. L1K21]